MANRLWDDMMTVGMEPEKISGSGSGHGLQSQYPNIGSQVDNSDSGSKKRKWRNDIESNAAKANEERPEEGRAEVTPRTGRGRPKGSKNKPKDGNDVSKTEISKKLKCHALEIPDGNDVSKTLETLARRSEVGVFIVSGTGMVSNVTLCHPALPAGMRTYAGPLQILSLAGAFPHGDGTENQEATGITVSLMDEGGFIVAGRVVGNLVVFDSVSVVVVAGKAVDMHCERLNVQPMPVQPVPVQPCGLLQPVPVQPCGLLQPVPVQPCGLFQPADLTELQQQINRLSEINSLSADFLVTLPCEHRPDRW